MVRQGSCTKKSWGRNLEEEVVVGFMRSGAYLELVYFQAIR